MGFWYKKLEEEKRKKEKKKGYFFFHFMGERLCSVLEEGFQVSFWDLGVGRFYSKALQILGRRFNQSID